MKNILVTGGAGFIGSNFIRYLFGAPAGSGPGVSAPEATAPRFSGRLVNLDKLTYAGNPANLADIEAAFGSRYIFEHADICDPEAVLDIFKRYDIDTVVHFAAESHVDRSIFGPRAFVETNVTGTLNLLEAARASWPEPGAGDTVPAGGESPAAGKAYRFHHVSTDEVYGSLGPTGFFTEETPYDPRSPYSASKASSDHLVRAYHHTFGVPVTITNCSNNYGPYQFPEKLIPVMVLNMRDGKPLPIYGDGGNTRDWLYVEDHSAAIWRVLTAGEPGRTYNVGGRTEKTNLELVNLLCDTMASVTGEPVETYRKLITFVTDRPGHDRRYAIDSGRIEGELGWAPETALAAGLEKTIRWYLENPQWIENITSGDYREWISRNYGAR
jgi:dTDP-glucose 4,6-dehydratase